jgi:hypothetical protein
VGCPPQVPVTGARKTVKIFGAIELWRARFDYRQETVFNAATYLGFLDQLARCYRRRGAILIQDNASYHKDREVWAWFQSNRHWLEVHQLPPYSPELNPTERLWQHTPNGQKTRRGRCPTHEPHFKRRFMINQARQTLCLGQTARILYIYICEIAKHDPLSLPLRLRRLPLVVLQQTAQPLPTPHRCPPISCSFRLQRKQNQILFTLVVALLVVMHHILLQRSPQ